MSRSLCAALLAAAALACGPPDSEPAARPSIVFVSLDTLSARHLSLHGYERATSPHLERLAEEAVVFERCYSNAPWTTPSYLSQLTGLYPYAFQTRAASEAAGPLGWVLLPEHETLAERLAGAGYRTAAFVDNPNITAATGLAQGFELYDESAAARPVEDPDGGLAAIVPRALEWLDGLAPDEPFFLFVNALDTHAPYVPPATWRDAFDDAAAADERTAPVAAEPSTIFEALPLYAVAPIEEEGERPERRRVAPFVRAYDQEIRATDELLAGFFAELRRRGLFDPAVVVVSSDHGESCGQRSTYFCHQTLYVRDLHVPLVLRLPGGRDGGRRVAGEVQLVDLFPTLLELAGLEVPGERHGRSLLPLAAGRSEPAATILADTPLFESRAVLRDGWKLLEYRLDEDTAGPVSLLTHPRTRAWIAEHHPEYEGLVYGTRGFPTDDFRRQVLGDLEARGRGAVWGRQVELYHLAADPEETRDLAAARPETVRELEALLEREWSRAAAARRGTLEARELDEEALEKLRDLGYLGR